MIRIVNYLKHHRQFALYTLIGLSGVSIDVAFFFILFNIVNLEKNLATFISLTCAITNNFVWNVVFNFKVRDRLKQRFLRFYLVGLTGFALTALFFLVFTDWIGISANITKLISLLPILLLQYTINKLWSFRNHEEI
jgi:putative flippase GtrA